MGGEVWADIANKMISEMHRDTCVVETSKTTPHEHVDTYTINNF